MSVRIHELAKELGLDNKKMMALLKARKIIAPDVKTTVSSYVDDEQAAALRKEFKKNLEIVHGDIKDGHILVGASEPKLGFTVGEPTSKEPNEFSIWIDPGGATEEDIVELFAALSDLNQAEGGPGLVFARDRKELPLTLVPA